MDLFIIEQLNFNCLSTYRNLPPFPSLGLTSLIVNKIYDAMHEHVEFDTHRIEDL